MSLHGRSSFAEALTRFSMTSKDSGDSSEEERSEGLHAYEAEPPYKPSVGIMRTNSAPNVFNSSLEGKENPQLQRIE